MTSSNESVTQETPSKDEQPESEVLNFDKADFQFVAKNCQWRQQGPYLVCKSCFIEHATYIGMEKILVGMDEEGKPIIKNRLEI